MAREGIPITVIQRQLGHADLGVTSVYLRGIDNNEIIDTVHGRRPPMMPASAGRNQHVTVRNPHGPESGSRRLLIGRTDGGRCLTLVIEQTVEPTTWLVITGWDSTDVERKLLGS
jgi:hypothetical protein